MGEIKDRLLIALTLPPVPDHLEPAPLPAETFIEYSHRLVCVMFHAVIGHLHVKHELHNQMPMLSGSMLSAHSALAYHMGMLEGAMVNSGCPEALADRSREESFSNGYEEAIRTKLDIEGGYEEDEEDGGNSPHTIH